MTSYTGSKTPQAVGCLVCFLLVFAESEPSEFGWLTGPLFKLHETGMWLFLLALILTFPIRRVAAGIGVAAALLCLPWYLYSVFPGAFRFFWPGEYSVPPYSIVVFDRSAIVRIAVLAVAAWLCIDSLRSHGSPQKNALPAQYE